MTQPLAENCQLQLRLRKVQKLLLLSELTSLVTFFVLVIIRESGPVPLGWGCRQMGASAAWREAQLSQGCDGVCMMFKRTVHCQSHPDPQHELWSPAPHCFSAGKADLRKVKPFWGGKALIAAVRGSR